MHGFCSRLFLVIGSAPRAIIAIAGILVAVVNDQRRIFDSFRGHDLQIARSICLVGVMEKHWDVCAAANQYILYWNKYFVRGTTVADV